MYYVERNASIKFMYRLSRKILRSVGPHPDCIEKKWLIVLTPSDFGAGLGSYLALIGSNPTYEDRCCYRLSNYPA